MSFGWKISVGTARQIIAQQMPQKEPAQLNFRSKRKQVTEARLGPKCYRNATETNNNDTFFVRSREFMMGLHEPLIN